MSIFKSTWKPYVQRQVQARQDLVKSPSRDSRFLQYTSGKNSWCRMTSLVNYDSEDQRFKGQDLSRKYVLEAGTLVQEIDDPNKLSLRRGVGVRAGSYGGNIGGKSLGLRPMPGITSVDIKSKSAYGSLREAEVKFFAWDKEQLEDLEILFMRTGYSVLLEYGWSMYLDTFKNDLGSDSATVVGRVPIADVRMKNFIEPTINAFDEGMTPPDVYAKLELLRHKFSGNYDGMLAFIRNFSYTMLPNGGYECTTVLISIGDVLDSIKINSSTYPLNTTSQDNSPKKNDRLLTRFEQIFLPILDLNTDYVKNTVMGQNITRYKKNGDNNLDPNIDFGVYKIAYNSVPSSLMAEGNKAPRGGLHYISFGSLVAIMNTQFGLYDPRNGNNVPLIDIEVPYPGYGTYGNGLCLASADSISIDPGVCLVNNPYASFITGTPQGFIATKADNFNPFHYQGNKSLGIIANIYVCVEFVIDKFRTMSAASDGTVDMRKFLEGILEDISYAMGSINDFGFFVTDSSAAIIDTHYVEDPSTAKQNKFTVNILGTDSVIRSFNINSKIFAAQATMVAIGAQDRGNISAVQSSTYNYLNKGLTDRVIKQKLDADAVSSITNTSGSQDQEYKDKLSHMVLDLRTYVKSYLVDRDLSQVSANRQAANSNLNSVIVKIDTDTNFKAIIPISVEITFDGIGGITQGEIFRLNPDTLPREYVNKNLGFIVTAINNHIEGSDWTTTIGTQCCLLDQEGVQLKAVKIDKDSLNTNIAGLMFAQQQAALQTAKDTLQKDIYIYNNLIKLLVAIVGPFNPDAIDIININVADTNLFQPGTTKVNSFTFDFFISRPPDKVLNNNDENLAMEGPGQFIVNTDFTDSNTVYNIPGTNYPGYPTAVIKPLMLSTAKASNFVNDIKIDSRQQGKDIIQITGKQYILNPVADNAFPAIKSLIQNYPDYPSITNDILKQAITKVINDIQLSLNGNNLNNTIGIPNTISSFTDVSRRSELSQTRTIEIPLYYAPNGTPVIYHKILLSLRIEPTSDY